MNHQQLSEKHNDRGLSQAPICPACACAIDPQQVVCEDAGRGEPPRPLVRGEVTCCDFCGALLAFDQLKNPHLMHDSQRQSLFKNHHAIYLALLQRSARSFLGRQRPGTIDMAWWN